MDFTLSEEQSAFQDTVRAFAGRELETDAIKRAHSEKYPREVAKKMAGAGKTTCFSEIQTIRQPAVRVPQKKNFFA